MYEDLQTLANLKFARASEEIAKEISDRLRELQSRMASRGMLQSGGTVKATVNLYAEGGERACSELTKIWTELILKRDGRLTSDAVSFVSDNVRKCAESRAKRDPPEIASSLNLTEWAKEELKRKMDGAVARISRDLMIQLKEDELSLRVKQVAALGRNLSQEAQSEPARVSHEWDLFICHASEDKEDFVLLLAEALSRAGCKVWYDDFTLTVGDGLRRSIDRGLASSRYGVVVLSPSFFLKEWPQKELDGLVAREIDGKKVVLPLWHNVTREIVVKYSPTLADRVAAKSSEGVEVVVNKILEATK